MPHPKSSSSHLPAIYIFVSIFILLSSCETHQFLLPQPVDRNNIEEFPKDFRGTFDVESEDISFQVNRKNVSLIMRDTIKIVTGAWPRQNKNGELVKIPPSFLAFRSIIPDTLKRSVDTIDNYFVAGDLIFELKDQRYLSKGYLYYNIGDSIYLLKHDTLCIDLGQNAFLRRLNKSFYVLNILDRVYGSSSEESNGWWQIILLEINAKGTINVWDNTHKLEGLPCMFFPRDPSKLDHYYNCVWTADEIIQLIEAGYFELSSKLQKRKK